MCSNEELKLRLKEWRAWDKNEKTLSEIEQLVSSDNDKELCKRLCERMEFGTAGLRAAMGAGFSQMNDLTIIQTTQGFAMYMLESTPNVKQRGVVIGYDARHNSKRFAELSAAVLLNKGIPVYLMSDICPTPYVAYAVLKKDCDWGIMVTASHNPKEDNGYKVYYANGAQIISPHDKGISAHIAANLEPWPTSWDISITSTSRLCTDPLEELHQSYISDLNKLCHHRDLNTSTPLVFTYTAMHGVGYRFICEAFKAFGFKPCIAVAEQIKPDPEFPTVKYPNPEEGKSALDLAMRTAEKNGSSVILANDPDADRLALAEQQSDGHWHVFTGNEMGGLIGWWRVKKYSESAKNTKGDDGKAYCLASAVSSRLLRTICETEGVGYVETLTGFKWMGNKSCDLMIEGASVLFAFEEAIGFMCGTTVLDKDGVSACVVTAEMTAYLHSIGLTISDKLNDLYKTYGHHVSDNSYFICHDPPTIRQLFEHLRNYESPGQYPKSCGRYPIKYIRDLTTGYDNSQPDMKAVLPTSKSSQMVTFTFENGCVVTLRTSGTEPKIKYYTELGAKPGTEREKVAAELSEIVKAVIENFLQPTKYGLIARQL